MSEQQSVLQDYKSLLGYEKQVQQSQACNQVLICVENVFEKIAIKGIFDLYGVSCDMS